MQQPTKTEKRLFEAGQIVMTRGVNDEIADNIEFAKFVTKSLSRHLTGDWGNLCSDDMKMNDSAVRTGGNRIFCSYRR